MTTVKELIEPFLTLLARSESISIQIDPRDKNKVLSTMEKNAFYQNPNWRVLEGVPPETPTPPHVNVRVIVVLRER